MSTQTQEGTGTLPVIPAAAADHALAGNGAFRGHHQHAVRPHDWRDPRGAELVRSSLASAASAFSLTVMVLVCLTLVSIASARIGILVPAQVAKPGSYPRWLAGPTGALTSWFNADAHTQRVLFTAGVAVMLVAYMVVVYSAPRLRPAWVIGAIVALHVIFLLSPPFNLTDVFNYLNYGRMEVVHHLNPYTTMPALEPASDPTFPLSNWHGLLSPYGPLFTVFTMALVPLGVAGSFWAMKAALMLASLATVYLVYRCAALLGRNPLAAAVIVGINPLLLVWGLAGDHNDFLMIFFLVLACWLLLRAREMRVGRYARAPREQRGVLELPRRAWAWLDGMPRPLVAGEPAPWMEIVAGIAVVAAVAIKASSAVLVPVLLAGAPRRARFALGVLIGAAAAVAMTYLAFGVNLPNIGQQGQLVIPDGIPNLVGLALGLGGASAGMRHVLSYVLVGVVACATVWTWHTRRWLTASGWVTFVLIVTLSWTLPWYIAWLLPFCALARSRVLRIAAVVLGVYMYLAWFPYSSEVLAYLHVNPANTIVGQQETNFLNSVLF
jgi:hypothetical protein